MSLLQERYNALLDQQHRLPAGWIGRLIGARMVRQHGAETHWTLARLHLSAGDRVLELGFGAGQGLALAAQTAVNGMVIGLDLSPTMLSAALQRNRRAVKQGRLAVLRGDIAALPFAEAQFDKIFSIHTLYFWPEPGAIIRRLFQMLRPGGTLMLTLSPGRISPAGERSYWPVYQTLREVIIPAMRESGFARTALEDGPSARGYMSIAAIAEKL